MSEIEFLGMLILALATFGGLFSVIYKPLKENTEAMTALTLRVEELTKRMDEQRSDFEDYKTHVSNGQRKQWDEINKHGDMLIRHEMEINSLKGGAENE